jgi:hypothetical protein
MAATTAAQSRADEEGKECVLRLLLTNFRLEDLSASNIGARKIAALRMNEGMVFISLIVEIWMRRRPEVDLSLESSLSYHRLFP